jgi:hypothetical protein
MIEGVLKGISDVAVIRFPRVEILTSRAHRPLELTLFGGNQKWNG